MILSVWDGGKDKEYLQNINLDKTLTFSLLAAFSAHLLLSHTLFKSALFQAWRTVLVDPLYGKLILNLVK